MQVQAKVNPSNRSNPGPYGARYMFPTIKKYFELNSGDLTESDMKKSQTDAPIFITLAIVFKKFALKLCRCIAQKMFL